MTRLVSCALVLGLLCGGQASAGIVYSDLGPGGSYDVGQGDTELGSPGDFVRQGSAFTVGPADVSFDAALLALGFVSGPNQIALRLYDDAGGKPGAVLETIQASGSAGAPSYPLVTFNSALHPLLLAGDTYWLVPFASGSTYAVWDMNDQFITGPHAYSDQEEPTAWITGTRVSGAFEVTGTPTPAPPSLTLAVLGVLCVGAYGWGRRKRAAA